MQWVLNEVLWVCVCVGFIVLLFTCFVTIALFVMNVLEDE
jgi:hypothetical protein